MHWLSRTVLAGLFLALAPVSAIADICARSPDPEKGDQARAEQLRVEAAERAARETERRSWDIRMFTLKNSINERDNNFRALCIFRIEVVLQPALKLVQVRAPKELMATIEEAVKGLDVPPPPPPAPYSRKNVEVTAYVLIASSVPDSKWMPVPRELQSVADQLKNILPNDPVYLADTVVARGVEGNSIVLTGDTRFRSGIRVRTDGVKSIVGLDGLDVQSNGGGFNTSIDVPVGTQVVVGRASSAGTAPGGVPNAVKRALLLVISAKILD